MQVLFAHLVLGDCSKVKMIILISYLHVRARRFQWFKMNGFLAESHLFAFNNLRIVYSAKKTPIIDCITHLLLMTLHSERCLIGRYSIWFTDVFSNSYLINYLWNSSCGSDFMCSKK